MLPYIHSKTGLTTARSFNYLRIHLHNKVLKLVFVRIRLAVGFSRRQASDLIWIAYFGVFSILSCMSICLIRANFFAFILVSSKREFFTLCNEVGQPYQKT